MGADCQGQSMMRQEEAMRIAGIEAMQIDFAAAGSEPAIEPQPRAIGGGGISPAQAEVDQRTAAQRPARPPPLMAQSAAPEADLPGEPAGLFGVPLELAAARSDRHGLVPSPIRKGCAYLIEQRLLGTEGLTRRPGSKRVVKQLIEGFNQDPAGFDFPPGTDALDVASTMIQYILALVRPEGGTDYLWGTDAKAYAPKAIRAGSRDPAVWTERISALVHALPPVKLATLKTLVHFQHEASKPEWAATNRMRPELFARWNFAILWAQTIMIEHYENIFHDIRTE